MTCTTCYVAFEPHAPAPSDLCLPCFVILSVAECADAKRSAIEHCRRADDAEAAVGENCKTIARLTAERDAALAANAQMREAAAYRRRHAR
jgi:hypothetical protein